MEGETGVVVEVPDQHLRTGLAPRVVRQVVEGATTHRRPRTREDSVDPPWSGAPGITVGGTCVSNRR